MTYKVFKPSFLLSYTELLAEQELTSYASGMLEKDAKEREHQRREGFRDHVHLAGKVVFWIIILTSITIVLLWIWHLSTPAIWHFLASHQLAEIKSLIFSGTVATVASAFIKRYF